MDDETQPGLMAARNQGLLTLRGLLALWGHEPDLENTGGFCMALVEYVLGDEGEEVVVAAGEGDGTYYVTRMPASVWQSAPGETRDSADFDPEGATVYGVHNAVDRWRSVARGESR